MRSIPNGDLPSRYECAVAFCGSISSSPFVNSLLQLIDTSNSNSLFITATNHESLLNKAVWRRFDEVIFFGKPDLELRTVLLKRYLTRIRYSEINLENFAADLEEKI